MQENNMRTMIVNLFFVFVFYMMDWISLGLAFAFLWNIGHSFPGNEIKLDVYFRRSILLLVGD